MFTGIVEEIGIIKNTSNGLTITAQIVLKDLHIGDSIAVNGICLTVTSFTSNSFTVDVIGETYRRTNLSKLKIGSSVNLERAMPMNGRFGGHIVSGHIDGIGTIIDIGNEKDALWITISTDNKILKYIIEKGSVTIDGVSLTVAYIDDVKFKVSLIPHTQSQTILHSKGIGDTVNLENDIIAKYIEKLFVNKEKKDSNIDINFLTRCGF